MKKGLFVILVILLCITAGCSTASNEDIYTKCPINELQWGMSLEEVMDALKLSTANISESSKGLTVINVPEYELDGKKVTLNLTLSEPELGNIGLAQIEILGDSVAILSITETLEMQYGEYSGTANSGNSYFWSYSSAKELSESVQERVRIYFERLYGGDSWTDVYLNRALITIVVSDNSINYDASMYLLVNRLQE